MGSLALYVPHVCPEGTQCSTNKKAKILVPPCTTYLHFPLIWKGIPMYSIQRSYLLISTHLSFIQKSEISPHDKFFSTNIIHGGILWQISGVTVSDNYKGSFEKGQISCSKRSFIVCPKYLINPSLHTNKARLFGGIFDSSTIFLNIFFYQRAELYWEVKLMHRRQKWGWGWFFSFKLWRFPQKNLSKRNRLIL